MKYLISIILILSASLIPLPTEMAVSTYIVAFVTLVGGVLGFLLLMSKHNIFLRMLIPYLYINVFLSAYPEWSIMGYVLTMACFGWYILLIRQSKETLIAQKDIFVAILLINVFFCIVQFLNKDFALNMYKTPNMIFGTLGNPQILGSFLACIAGGVCLKKKWFVIPLLIICAVVRTKGAFISLSAGIMFYTFFKMNKKLWVICALLIALGTYGYCTWAAGGLLHKNHWSGRLKCWPRTIELCKERPIKGYGLATFKMVYPANSGDILDHDRAPWQIGEYKGDWVMYLRTHNDWLQILFETGLIGFTLFVGFVITLVVRFIRAVKTEELLIVTAGLVSIAVNMLGAFPMRMNRLTPLMLLILAIFHVLTKTKGERNEKTIDSDMLNNLPALGSDRNSSCPTGQKDA